MWYRAARVTLVLCMAGMLTAGLGWADEISNNSRIQNLEVDLLKEAEARMGVDGDLQQQIINESQQRMHADSTEAAGRIQGDANLQQQIDIETAARNAADAALQDQVNNEAQERMGADSVEAATRIQGDTDLQQQIDTIELTPGPAGPVGPVGPDGTAYPGQLVSNTLTVDAETDEGAGWFNLVITFTSTDSFTAEFVEFAYDGECFRRSDMTGSKQ